MNLENLPDLLLPGEVASIFRVDPKTVTRWANVGRLTTNEYLKTAGGHVRIRREAVYRMLNEQPPAVRREIERANAEDAQREPA